MGGLPVANITGLAWDATTRSMWIGSAAGAVRYAAAAEVRAVAGGS